MQADLDGEPEEGGPLAAVLLAQSRALTRLVSQIRRPPLRASVRVRRRHLSERFGSQDEAPARAACEDRVLLHEGAGSSAPPYGAHRKPGRAPRGCPAPPCHDEVPREIWRFPGPEVLGLTTVVARPGLRLVRVRTGGRGKRRFGDGK